MNMYPIPKKIAYSAGKVYINGFKIARCDFDRVQLAYPLSKINLGDTTLNIILDKTYKEQQYTLEIKSEARITASSPCGVHYAVSTLRQLKGAVPYMIIEDYPDFEHRGVMLDVSRGKVPKTDEMKKIISLLADMKYNHLQLYFEGIIYKYKGYEEYHQGKNPITAEYISEIQEYCKQRFIELVGNHNSFGHMMEWLTVDGLTELAECPQGYDKTNEFNHTIHNEPAVLNPLDPRTLNFIDSLYAQVLPNFESELLNVGCDETVELGMGYSKEKADKVGTKRVYTDYMNELHKLTGKYGKRMMFWADMIIDDVGALKRMPENSIPVVWGYEQEHPFYEQCKNAHDSGLDFYVAPGTCSWGSLTGRSENMMKNQLSAAENGKKFGASGYLLTDWGDGGHPQFMAVCYVPFAYGAGVAWGSEQNKDISAAFDYMDKELFGESGFSAFLYDCGLYYKLEAYKRGNSTALLSILKTKLEENHFLHDQTAENFESIIRYINNRLEEMKKFISCSAEYKEEIALNLKMARSMAKIGVLKLGGKKYENILKEMREQAKEYKRLWLNKNFAYDSDRYIMLCQKLIDEIENKDMAAKHV